jgi:hypothetical protein
MILGGKGELTEEISDFMIKRTASIRSVSLTVMSLLQKI